MHDEYGADLQRGISGSLRDAHVVLVYGSREPLGGVSGWQDDGYLYYWGTADEQLDKPVISTWSTVGPIQIMQRLPQRGFYQAQARSGPAIATTFGDQIVVALRSSVQGDDTLRTTTLSAGQTDFRGVKWTELRTGLTNTSAALLTDNIGIPGW